MAAPRTHYEILNVAPDAELVVIEAAYRALMKKYHPDQGGGAADGPSASDINRAYATLRDPQRRAGYDHDEWIRQRDIRLAAYQPLPAPPRKTNFFGWGGWLVSAVLAGMIALMASKTAAPQLSEAERVGSALPADTRSQPVPPERSLVTPAQAAEIRADAYAPKRNRAAAPASVPPAAIPSRADAVEEAGSAAAAPPAAHPAHREAYARRHPAAHRRGPAVAARRDRDFLERQGYIY